MVEGRLGQAHRPGHVREDLTLKKPAGTGRAASRTAFSPQAGFNGAHRRCPAQSRRESILVQQDDIRQNWA